MVSSNFLLKSAIATALLCSSSVALAHYPLMTCEFEGEKIECQAGYSDGSKAVNYEVKMYDYNDNLIAKEKTDHRSIVTFNKSVDEFYIVFDSGHEYPVEVDSVEISE